ncbi:MAG: TIGR00730 family Rossman fold protein [Bacteroidales bacterium]|nr:TIGR00730 family Rossman fold protein [Bacteroidales bacterium]
MKKIVIFCSSSEGIDPRYTAAAGELVEGLCRKGYGIVSGGSFRGTMGVVADTVKACGGYHKGVLPAFMTGLVYDGLSETLWTPTMAERKQEMRRDTVAAIALPGGIGTLDELIETHVLIKLKQYHGRLILLNTAGFYEPFKALLDHYVATKMLTPADRSLIEFFDTPEQLLATF